MLRLRTIESVVFAGGILTAMATGIATALVQDKRVYIPIVATGIGLTLTQIFRGWTHGRHGREIHTLIVTGHPLLHLLLFVLSLGVQAVALFALFVGYAGASAPPYVCFTGPRGHSWFNLTLGAGIGTFMEVAALGASIINFYGATLKSGGR